MLDLKPIVKSFDLPDGRKVELETGVLAKQADGSCLVKVGNTVIFASVVSSKELREGQSFFPLSVDYQEKFSSAGRIPGGFLKREGRLSDREILICRLVDRAIRPLFPDGYMYETQVILQLISADEETKPDALAALAASTALAISDIPFNGPISEARVIVKDGKHIVNPTRSQMEGCTLDIIVGATMENVTMVEGEMDEVSEDELVEAIKIGHEAIKVQVKAQLELAEMVGATENRPFELEEYVDEDLKAKIYDFAKTKMYDIVSSASAKHDRSAAFKQLKEDLKEHLGEFPEDDENSADYVGEVFYKLMKETVRNMIVDEGKRLDGRKTNEVRDLWIKTNYLPSPHGSAVFTRGETQSLTTVTLGSKRDEQMIDSALENYYNRFILHYNFPGFSTGEVRPSRGPGRREIGHGNLAMRSLKRVLPTVEECPYTIRVVSDILESNGSSSMATVCAGSLALMDAGVPLKTGVSGIAMGMVYREDGKYAILSDILGDEDHLGDMDFKVTGTKNGICACQMDIKIDGLPYEQLVEALNQAKDGRMEILNKMNDEMETHRDDYKDHVPRIVAFEIPSEFIGAIIGPGGKNIQELQLQTNTTISIDSEDGADVGMVNIFGANKEGVTQAREHIKAVVAQPEVGEVYEATVKSIQPYGAFVEFMPGKEGLLHISEIMWKRVETMDGVFELGDKIKVKLLDVDKRSGKFKLSRKATLPKPEKNA